VEIAIMHSIRDSDPYIDKPDARDHSADKTLTENEPDRGPCGEERVLGPEACPR
jgi:hypothetical protein